MRLLDYLYDFLDRSSSMGMFTETYRVRLYLLYDLRKLFFQAILSNLLGQIVTERIVHDIKERIYGMLEDDCVYPF